jgi:hypothetical protein
MARNKKRPGRGPGAGRYVRDLQRTAVTPAGTTVSVPPSVGLRETPRQVRPMRGGQQLPLFEAPGRRTATPNASPRVTPDKPRPKPGSRVRTVEVNKPAELRIGFRPIPVWRQKGKFVAAGTMLGSAAYLHHVYRRPPNKPVRKAMIDPTGVTKRAKPDYSDRDEYPYLGRTPSKTRTAAAGAVFGGVGGLGYGSGISAIRASMHDRPVRMFSRGAGRGAAAGGVLGAGYLLHQRNKLKRRGQFGDREATQAEIRHLERLQAREEAASKSLLNVVEKADREVTVELYNPFDGRTYEVAKAAGPENGGLITNIRRVATPSGFTGASRDADGLKLEHYRGKNTSSRRTKTLKFTGTKKDRKLKSLAIRNG